MTTKFQYGNYTNEPIQKEPEVIKFEVDKTYYGRSIGDHNCIWAYKVTKRTNSFITVVDIYSNEVKRCKINVYENIEKIYPDGKYSMAVSIYANKTEELKPDWEISTHPEYKALRVSKIHFLKTELQECLEELMESELANKYERAKLIKIEYQEMIDEVQKELDAIAM